ncbi:hypothetical protein L1987_86724 [Smallanthus sonchifolius]|uniref:Uncharacterized protein n=1 Tax=Smallanthus sonchifolius TaxID=185202 RepID=A0ACB8Y1P0_9ASTR|nr:hypothetical protein L1987_86724 [Smallanthus sonchifolius]
MAYCGAGVAVELPCVGSGVEQKEVKILVYFKNCQRKTSHRPPLYIHKYMYVFVYVLVYNFKKKQKGLWRTTMTDSSASYIHMVHHLIEECLVFKMSKEECMEALSKHANIMPAITSTGSKTKKVIYEIVGLYTQRCCGVYDDKRRRVAEIKRKEAVECATFGGDV